MMSIEIHLLRKRQVNRARQLEFAMGYRNVSQTELAKNVKGLTQPKLSKFLKGVSELPDNILKECMIYLDFPFEFLDITIHNVSTTHKL
jgi:hypothetical protein